MIQNRIILSRTRIHVYNFLRKQQESNNDDDDDEKTRNETTKNHTNDRKTSVSFFII